MANQVRALELFRYRYFQINKDQPLGHGAYGVVYKAKCDQLPCAAKVLHPTILDHADPGVGAVMQRFLQECTFLESIRHPNIVQYLGMTRDPESRLPVLLMELLDESLTKMLERSQKTLAYFVQVNICHDVALALAYLHSNDIIHRDLSSNNVLIMAKRRAKVTDFGMSKLAGVAPSMTPLTMCPGTLAYMPPEALEEPPIYTKKLDCFSEGVIMIQVCTRIWPAPGPRSKTVPFPGSPTGMTKVPVLESERRKSHIDMIDGSHPLLPIAMDCICYQEKERPSSEELCQRMADLKDTGKYQKSVELVEREQIDIVEVESLLEEMQVREKAIVKQPEQIPLEVVDELERQFVAQIQRLNKQLEQKEQVTIEIQQTNHSLQGQLQRQEQHSESQIQALHRQLNEQEQVTSEVIQINHSLQRQVEQLQQQEQQSQSQIHRLYKQLEEQEQVTSDFVQTNNSLHRQVEELKGHAHSQVERFTEIQQTNHSFRQQVEQQPSQQSQGNAKPLKLPTQLMKKLIDKSRPLHVQKSYPQRQPPKRIEWRNKGKAPITAIARGAAVLVGNVAYFMNYDGQMYSHDHSTDKFEVFWGPSKSSSLVSIRGLLTAVGGEADNKLHSLIGSGEIKKWAQLFPPMPTKRHSTAAVTTNEHLIVAGGVSGHFCLTTVEAMDIETRIWSIVADLPHPCSCASATICRDRIYIMGGNDLSDRTKSVLTCSLAELLHAQFNSPLLGSVWSRIADAPLFYSTCATLEENLVSVGGQDLEYQTSPAVHMYDPTSDSWDHIGNMKIPKYRCIVVVLPNNEMTIVGGQKNFTVYTNSIDTATMISLI